MSMSTDRRMIVVSGGCIVIIIVSPWNFPCTLCGRVKAAKRFKIRLTLLISLYGLQISFVCDVVDACSSHLTGSGSFHFNFCSALYLSVALFIQENHFVRVLLWRIFQIGECVCVYEWKCRSDSQWVVVVLVNFHSDTSLCVLLLVVSWVVDAWRIHH